jgi:hypothetical protein
MTNMFPHLRLSLAIEDIPPHLSYTLSPSSSSWHPLQPMASYPLLYTSTSAPQTNHAPQKRPPKRRRVFVLPPQPHQPPSTSTPLFLLPSTSSSSSSSSSSPNPPLAVDTTAPQSVLWELRQLSHALPAHAPACNTLLWLLCDLQITVDGHADVTKYHCRRLVEVLKLLHAPELAPELQRTVPQMDFWSPGTLFRNAHGGREHSDGAPGLYLLKMRPRDVAAFPWEASPRDARLAKWAPVTRPEAPTGLKAYVLQDSVGQARTLMASDGDGAAWVCLGLLMRSAKNQIKSRNARKKTY